MSIAPEKLKKMSDLSDQLIPQDDNNKLSSFQKGQFESIKEELVSATKGDPNKNEISSCLLRMAVLSARSGTEPDTFREKIQELAKEVGMQADVGKLNTIFNNTRSTKPVISNLSKKVNHSLQGVTFPEAPKEAPKESIPKLVEETMNKMEAQANKLGRDLHRQEKAKIIEIASSRLTDVSDKLEFTRELSKAVEKMQKASEANKSQDSPSVYKETVKQLAKLSRDDALSKIQQTDLSSKAKVTLFRDVNQQRAMDNKPLKLSDAPSPPTHKPGR